MVRLILIFITTLYCLLMADYCDLQYPVFSDYYNELWDRLKHQMYLILAVLMGGIAYFKAESKHEWIVIANDMALSLLLFGILPTMITEKNQNRFAPHELSDYLWLAGSLLIGLIFYYVRRRSTCFK